MQLHKLIPHVTQLEIERESVAQESEDAANKILANFLRPDYDPTADAEEMLKKAEVELKLTLELQRRGAEF